VLPATGTAHAPTLSKKLPWPWPSSAHRLPRPDFRVDSPLSEQTSPRQQGRPQAQDTGLDAPHPRRAGGGGVGGERLVAGRSHRGLVRSAHPEWFCVSRAVRALYSREVPRPWTVASLPHRGLPGDLEMESHIRLCGAGRLELWRCIARRSGRREGSYRRLVAHPPPALDPRRAAPPLGHHRAAAGNDRKLRQVRLLARGAWGWGSVP